MTPNYTNSIVQTGLFAFSVGYIYMIGYAYCRNHYENIFTKPSYNSSDIDDLVDTVLTHCIVSVFSIITIPASPIILYRFVRGRRFS